MCEDHATTEADRCRDDKRIDGQFAASARRSEKVTGDSVQLHEHCRWHSHREVPLVGAAERSAHEVMTLQILGWTCERAQRFAVQN